MSALNKWNVGGGGDSRITRLTSKAAVRKLRRVCVMLNIAGVAGRCSNV